MKKLLMSLTLNSFSPSSLYFDLSKKILDYDMDDELIMTK